MKKRLFVMFLAAALMLSLIPNVLAIAPEDIHNSETHLRTHYSDDNYLDIQLNGFKVTISGVVTMPGLTKLSLMCIPRGESVEIPVSSGKYFSRTLTLNTDPEETDYSIGVVAYKNTDEYVTLLANLDNIIHVTSSGLVFGTGMPIHIYYEDGTDEETYENFLTNNREFLSEWINPVYGLTRHMGYVGMVSWETTPTIRAKSNEIVGSETNDYEKLKLLHDWVADNIYYDYDNYLHDKPTKIDPDGVLATRRTVCAGYSALLIDLIQAQGIPAIYVTGWANGGHAWVEAFADGRWVFIDATWDSKNSYEYGQWTKGPFSRKYFDASLELYSFSHKIEERENVKMEYIRTGESLVFDSAKELLAYYPDFPQDQLAQITFPMSVAKTKQGPVNHNTVTKQTRPSDWALEECFLALHNELIPYVLQKNYQSPISRENFCHAIINMLMVREGADSVEALLAKHGLTMKNRIFTDTDDKDIRAANLLGIVNGVGNNLFQPDRNISRQEAAAMLMRAAKGMGVTPGRAKQFIDTASLQSWAKEGIDFVSGLVSQDGKAVMGGTGANKFSPLSDYTTEQSILTVYRLFRCR